MIPWRDEKTINLWQIMALSTLFVADVQQIVKVIPKNVNIKMYEENQY